ncbi:hypothetical protein PPL_00986 [Heterostelium album PN500]|uniref:Uncharacterized protein n=1 Tax=Heterostelium pallidum (strain ATCC 26659 / Pp 5 / PN500) TaxID=670386 RepID=D3AXS9_HETP5|nr:hypothetical protein PPL_00986 [Heterostelium album PN500]EFA85756.1 hypothetical protein PPL_00986 [Heterostelium album PN500]|eukprot:XP_020437862.1 hypothetical protein PPL_00986 [Heterostelium album PN500]
MDYVKFRNVSFLIYILFVILMYSIECANGYGEIIKEEKVIDQPCKDNCVEIYFLCRWSFRPNCFIDLSICYQTCEYFKYIEILPDEKSDESQLFSNDQIYSNIRQQEEQENINNNNNEIITLDLK